MSKKVLIVVTGLFVLAMVVMHLFLNGVFTASSPSFQPAPATAIVGTADVQVKALAICTGIAVNDATANVAYANCLGKIRGFVDAHSILTELAAADPRANQNLALWCISREVSDKQLIDAMFAWIGNNEVRFGELIEMYSEANATAAVIIASLNATYPCKKASV